MTELVYPHIEIGFDAGRISLSLVKETDRKVLLETRAGYLNEIEEMAKKALPAMDAESESYADDNDVVFNPSDHGLDFEHLVDQLKEKVTEYEARDVDKQISDVLASNFQADLLLGFRRAVYFQILTTTLGLAGDNGSIENFVLKGGEPEVIEWFTTDMETLGYDLQFVGV